MSPGSKQRNAAGRVADVLQGVAAPKAEGVQGLVGPEQYYSTSRGGGGRPPQRMTVAAKLRASCLTDFKSARRVCRSVP